MKPSVLAIRTLAVEFVLRIYRPIVIVVAIIAAVLTVGSVLLTNLHEAWWILVVAVVMLSIIAAGVLILAWLAIRAATPTRTKDQKEQAKALVDKLERMSEVTTTPPPVLFFRIMRDVTKPSPDGFVGSLATDSSSLKSDFAKLKDSFQ